MLHFCSNSLAIYLRKRYAVLNFNAARRAKPPVRVAYLVLIRLSL
jgi:hypothetical protein